MGRLHRFAAVLLVACSITACGGGGGGGGGDSGSAASGSGSSAPTPVSPTLPASESTTTTPTTPTATAHTLQLSWSVPATREDGSALAKSDLAGYQIYYYQDGSSADGETVSVAGGSSTSAQIAINGSGTYYFAIAALDQNGLLSQLSNYVAVTLD